MSLKSSKKGISSDGGKTEFIQLLRDVNRQSIRDRMHLHMAEQSICSERLHVKQFSKDVEGEIFRDSGRKLDASYYFKLHSVLINIRRIDFLNNIARKVISAKNLVSMIVLFCCLKCGRKARPYSVFCSGDCNRRCGHPETDGNGGKKQTEKLRRVSVVMCRMSKPKPQPIPASWNPVVNLERLSNRAIAEILQAGLRANRSEPSEQVDIKVEVSSIQSLKPCSITLLERIDLKDEPKEDDVNKSRSNQQRQSIVDQQKSKEMQRSQMDDPKSIQKKNEITTQKPILKRRLPFVDTSSLSKIRRKSTIDKSRIVQAKPKPLPREITVLDKSKSIQKPKPIVQRRETTFFSGTSLIKIRHKSTINESKPRKIERQKLQAKPFISKPTVKPKPSILQRRQTTIVTNASSIKIRKSTIDETKPKKIESRRKSIVEAMKAVKLNKVRPTVSQPPLKTNSDIDETRAKMRQIFKQHLEERILEQLQITPYMNPLTNHETVIFARDVEQEMFQSFGYGSKYLKKYRELVLSMRNRNNNLILDIIRKVITPQRLVHMTSNELAGPDNIEERQNFERRNMELLAQSVADQLAHPPVLIRKSDQELIRTSEPINVDRNTSARDLLTAYNDLTGANLGDSSSYQPARIAKRRVSYKATVPQKD